MTIEIRSETTGGTTTGASDGTFSVTKPSSVSDGDYLVVVIGKQDEPDVAPPGDWTTGHEGGNATGNDRFGGIYYKKITNAAGEPSAYTFDSVGTSENVGWWIGSLSGVHADTPQDVAFNGTGAWAMLANDTSPNAPAVTTATNNAFALACWAINTDSATTPPSSPWSTRAANVGGGGVLTVVSQTFATAGTSTGTPEVTNVATGMESAVGTFVFRAGTNAYQQAAGGAITPDGSAVRRTNKPASGAITSAGVLVNSVRKVLDGALTGTGGLINSARKIFAGELTTAGAVSTLKIAMVAIGGELTSAGVLVLQTGKALAGAIAPDGGVIKLTAKALSGALTSAGELVRATGKILAGALSSAGNLVAQLISGGELFFQVVSGALASSGGVATLKASLVALGGALTMAGAMVMRTGKIVAGTLAPDGSITRRVAIAVSSALASAGVLVAVIPGAAGGIIQSFLKGIRRSLPKGFYKE